MDTYDIGDAIILEATFTVEKAETNPTTVRCFVRKPGSVEREEVVLSSSSTGIYLGTIVADSPGTWWYRFEGVGTAEAAGEGSFYVRRSHVGTA